MNNTMQYKGYTAAIEYSAEDECFVGQVIGIRHTIIFDGTSVEEIRANFQDMIDDYPAMCADLDQKPNEPVSESWFPFPRNCTPKYQARPNMTAFRYAR